MFINKNSIIINGINMGQFIVEAKFGYHKIWGKDSGRNLAGKMSGTLIGIFPKVTLQFRKLSKEELETIAPLLNSSGQSVSYYDPDLKQQYTMSTYTGDWEIVNKGLMQNEGFSCAFISIGKR